MAKRDAATARRTVRAKDLPEDVRSPLHDFVRELARWAAARDDEAETAQRQAPPVAAE